MAKMLREILRLKEWRTDGVKGKLMIIEVRQKAMLQMMLNNTLKYIRKYQISNFLNGPGFEFSVEIFIKIF